MKSSDIKNIYIYLYTNDMNIIRKTSRTKTIYNSLNNFTIVTRIML